MELRLALWFDSEMVPSSIPLFAIYIHRQSSYSFCLGVSVLLEIVALQIISTVSRFNHQNKIVYETSLK